MVVGARTKKSKISLLRRPGKKILGITANYLAGMKIPDLNLGFRAIKKIIAMEFMHILPNFFSFSTTITLARINSGYDVKYVPIEAPERVGKSKIKPFRDGFRLIMLKSKRFLLVRSLYEKHGGGGKIRKEMRTDLELFLEYGSVNNGGV